MKYQGNQESVVSLLDDVPVKIANLTIEPKNITKVLKVLNTVPNLGVAPPKGGFDCLENALSAYNYSAHIDSTGVCKITHLALDDKWRANPKFWIAIEKFINPEAVVIFRVSQEEVLYEVGYLYWRFTFKGGKFKEQRGKVTWEDLPLS